MKLRRCRRATRATWATRAVRRRSTGTATARRWRPKRHPSLARSHPSTRMTRTRSPSTAAWPNFRARLRSPTRTSRCRSSRPSSGSPAHWRQARRSACRGRARWRRRRPSRSWRRRQRRRRRRRRRRAPSSHPARQHGSTGWASGRQCSPRHPPHIYPCMHAYVPRNRQSALLSYACERLLHTPRACEL